MERWRYSRKTSFRSGWRAVTDHAVTGLAVLATALVIAPLIAIFVYLIYKGAQLAEPGFLHSEPQA